MKAASPVALALAAALCAPASDTLALDFDFAGLFHVDNEVVLLEFLMEEPGTVTVFSSSWLRGNHSGVPEDGFDPALGIWSAGGNLLFFQDDGLRTGATEANGVAYEHGAWDSFFEASLEPGRYLASISQYDNFPVGYYAWRSAGTPVSLGDGFLRDGVPDFTRRDGFGPQPYFNGLWSAADARTGAWEFHILNISRAAQVPEPSGLLLLGGGLGGLALLGVARRAGSPVRRRRPACGPGLRSARSRPVARA